MYYDNNGNKITVQRELAQGGEGTICTIHERRDVLLKLLNHPTAERAAKVRAMIARPFHNPGVAWPTNTVHDQRGAHVGLLIPRVDRGVHVSQVYNPTSRYRVAPGFTYEYLTSLAENIASVTQTLHDQGLVIGDIGDANFLVQPDATVTLIDADSIQVPRPDKNGYFRCAVGTEEYTPPELFGVNFATIDRTPHHDNHGLAVLLFRVLMEGVHPYASKYNGTGDPPRLAEKVRRGLWPYNKNHSFVPPPLAPPLTILPTRVQELFRQAFTDGHNNPQRRPSAGTWRDALRAARHDLRRCQHNNHHVYGNHLTACPWCPRTHAAPHAAPPVALPTSTTTYTFGGTLHDQLRYIINQGTKETVRTWYAIADQPNATPELRTLALHNANALPFIMRENEREVLQQAIPLWQQALNDPELPRAQRERITQHLRACEDRLRTL